MTKPTLKIKNFDVHGHYLDLLVEVFFQGEINSPHITALFDNKFETRRIRLMIKSIENGVITANIKIDLYSLFYEHKELNNISVNFYLNSKEFQNAQLLNEPYVFSSSIKIKSPSFINANNKEKLKVITSKIIGSLSLFFIPFKIRNNRVSFISNRTSVPTGNLEAVLNEFSKNKNLDIRVFCSTSSAFSSIKHIFKFLYLYSTSKIVFIDDYYHLVSYAKKKKNVTLVQLWHACGAFKTFGFSRMGTNSKLQQSSPNHRQYDFAIVSSKEVAPYYAEGFGISDKKILPLGSPRCDIFENSSYEEDFKTNFYNSYPQIKDKKVILFAPTFRGGGNGDAYYPFENFNINKILGALDESYCILIKMHPYISKRPKYNEKYNNQVVDVSDKDINKLLFVTDILISDYSSVIFEASLLNIPMLFYVFDLEEYTKSRDFYIDFSSFVPGKIVKNEDELISSLKSSDFKKELIVPFKERYFGNTIGKASKNVYSYFNFNILGDQ